MENSRVSDVEDRLLEALLNDEHNDGALTERQPRGSTPPEDLQDDMSSAQMSIPAIVEFQPALGNENNLFQTAVQRNHSTNLSSNMQPEHGNESDPFQTMMHEIADIRANTQVQPSGLAPFETHLGPPKSSPRSPIREHALFQPSPHRYKSPFQEITHPPLSAAHFLLRKFIDDLPLNGPSPFQIQIFVECPTQKRTLVERPVSTKEYDKRGRGTRRPPEMALVYDDPPKHRAHCVMAGSSKVVLDPQGQQTAEGFCTLWTRKYPDGWKGIYKNEAGKLVNFEDRGGNTVWLFSAAVSVELQGVETSIECVVPKKVASFEGVTYDVEPAWADVVNALREECSREPHREPSGQQQAVQQQAFQQQVPPQQAYPQQPFPQQVFHQHMFPQPQEQLIENHSPPKKRAPKTPKKSKKDQQSTDSPEQPSPPPKRVSQAVEQVSMPSVVPACIPSGDNVIPPNRANENQTIIPQREEHFGRPQVGPPLSWVDRPILPPLGQHNEGNTGGSGGGALGIEPDASNMIIEQPPRDPSPAPEQPKPKRKRAPAKKKQSASMQDVPEPAEQVNQAAESDTPPSTAKAGSKRKNSTTADTPAKKMTATKARTTKTPTTKTPKTKTPATKTPTIKTPATKPPSTKTSAKTRGRPSTKATPSSELRDDGSENGEDEQVMQDNVPEQPVHFGPPLHPVPSTGFEVQQMRLNQPVQDHGFQGNPSSQMSMPPWNNQQTRNDRYPAESSGNGPYIQAPQQQIYQQIRSIEAQQRDLFATCPTASDNSGEFARVMHQIGELAGIRNTLSEMSMRFPPSPYAMYQPVAWNNDGQPNYGMFSMHQNNGQVQSNNQMYPAQQNNGPYQMFYMQQNNGSHQDISQTYVPRWYNQSEGISGPDNTLPHPSAGYANPMVMSNTEPWATPVTPSFNQQGLQATDAYSTGSSMSNMNATPSTVPPRTAPNLNVRQSTPPEPQLPSPTQLALAEFPQEEVQRARSSVKSTLEKPFHGLAVNPGWSQQ